ncbi:cytochrome c peroxidase [Neolewinella xylanilytica]|uniref:Cytochrome c peroxidase n=1 Tax=Neolewinella xylanilytica TaxID=1514080 RepID=A0A2S6I2T7_9BACT|nr:cytochrome c peroxidase [Neolewinella xylanilytica]PPK85473.1 cytochrome c peroxidase [Neolewinella xylanilytica]
MKPVVCFLAVLIALGLNLSFTKQRAVLGEPGAAYAVFVTRTDNLVAVSEAVRNGGAGAQELQRAVADARLAYKRTAWLIDYYYPSFATKHFNGAPLLKAEKYGTHSTIEPPRGLQVLDEMVYTDPLDKEQIAILAKDVQTHARQLAGEVAGRPYALEEVLEAMRMEVIRIPTLYLTGFDTPGSLMGIPEAKAALEAMATILREQSVLADFPAFSGLLNTFDGAALHLSRVAHFDDFDRLAFQRDYLNGLYRELGELQREAGLPAAVRFPTGRNPNGLSLFADEFLDPYAYTELRAEEDGPKLRALGERLFYDPALSETGTLSCASCHRPERAFTDGSLGITDRNAPTLINAVYADRYFYDLRAFSLEQQAEHVIYDHGEFDTDYPRLIRRLSESPTYSAAFEEAFGRRATINEATFRAALASYVLSLRSFNSPFDRYARGETDVLDSLARRGYNLFMGKAGCGTCHFAPTFSGLVPPLYMDNESEILGVLAKPHDWTKTLDADRGRAAGGLEYENVWIYERSFKTPTVRNAALTAPYFHNGAYSSLEAVVNFYDLGGGAGIGLEVANQTLPADRLQLTPHEKAALIAFMESLTDPIPALSELTTR